MQAFSDLGEKIGRRWRARNYDESVFASIAFEELTGSEVLTRFSGDDVVTWVLRNQAIPPQNYTGFGQPPVVLYRGHEFYIEALFWFDSTTAIHQHAFSGAFGVLQGSSVHTLYGFTQGERVSSRLLLGSLDYLDCEVLRRGDVRAISAGNGFIHSLFHLEQPSVSVVVRTSAELEQNPQYTYFRPGLAIDPFYEPEPMMTQLRVLEVVRATRGANALMMAADTLLDGADFWFAYRLLAQVYQPLLEEGIWPELEKRARARFGERVDFLQSIFEERQRQHNIIARREQIHDQDHRFLLALLLNIPTREGIFRLIAMRHNADAPRELISRWLGELAKERSIGLDFNALSLFVLEYALEDASIEQVEAALTTVYPASQVQAQATKLRQLWFEIRNAVLLKPLFASSI